MGCLRSDCLQDRQGSSLSSCSCLSPLTPGAASPSPCPLDQLWWLLFIPEGGKSTNLPWLCFHSPCPQPLLHPQHQFPAHQTPPGSAAPRSCHPQTRIVQFQPCLGGPVAVINCSEPLSALCESGFETLGDFLVIFCEVELSR